MGRIYNKCCLTCGASSFVSIFPVFFETIVTIGPCFINITMDVCLCVPAWRNVWKMDQRQQFIKGNKMGKNPFLVEYEFAFHESVCAHYCQQTFYGWERQVQSRRIMSKTKKTTGDLVISCFREHLKASPNMTEKMLLCSLQIRVCRKREPS